MLNVSTGADMYSHASPAASVIPSTHSGRVLFSKGVYIRRRNGHWEAKIRTGGNFINSAFTEVLMSFMYNSFYGHLA